MICWEDKRKNSSSTAVVCLFKTKESLIVLSDLLEFYFILFFLEGVNFNYYIILLPKLDAIGDKCRFLPILFKSIGFEICWSIQTQYNFTTQYLLMHVCWDLVLYWENFSVNNFVLKHFNYFFSENKINKSKHILESWFQTSKFILLIACKLNYIKFINLFDLTLMTLQILVDY